LVTAFPYFAAIGIVAGSGASSPEKIFLVGLCNVVYVPPLIGIAIACAVMGADSLAESKTGHSTAGPSWSHPWPARLGWA
jgi:hypothetical protein